jgi:hypothetical protein
MVDDPDKWTQFNIRVYNDATAGDARRVVFEPRGHPARGGVSHPAMVVLRAGGDLIVRFSPPQPEVPGLTRDDFVSKAASTVRWLAGS